MRSINALSLCNGVGMATMALKGLGVDIGKMYVSEIDKFAIKGADALYPENINLGCLTTLRRATCWKMSTLIKAYNSEYLSDEVKENLAMATTLRGEHIDIAIFGTPCQSYSIAGKREGIRSKNGALIYECFALLEKLKPESFMFENVKGLMSIDKGETFKQILKGFNDAGYAVDFKLINSSLLTAQNRERIYVIGKRLDKCQGLTNTVTLTKEFINEHKQ